MLILTFILSRLISFLYHDPRPGTTIHIDSLSFLRPLLPHLATNSFPSGHAVLTGVIVAAVLFVSPRWTIPFVILGFLVEWARLGIGVHQAINSLGGWAVVALAASIAYVGGSLGLAILLPRLPFSWAGQRKVSRTG